MSASLCTLLGVSHPIIQAPMVGVSTPQLAAAVSEAGGLGSLGLGASTPVQARELIAQTRTLTDKPFNLNLFCHAPAVADAPREQAWLERLRPLFAEFGTEPPAQLREIYRSFLADPDMLEVLLELRPAVVSFHFGLPPQAWIERLKFADIRLLACVTTPEEARLAEAAGVDALVAQGIEAGGHRGVFAPEWGDAGLGTLALVRLLAQQSRLPIIAAGGIMDGAGINAALALGAAGVQLGTAFVLCPESAANAAYRAALKGEKAARTEITANISGRPARGLPNRLYGDLGAALPDYPICYDAAKALHAAASAQGNHDFAAQWAGQGAPLARELPAAELVATLVKEMQQA
ncbi:MULTISPECIES: nitronate monooxygenase [unclassified Pseudomonas]|uniref:NAD(P)H-dependent flavin oxidoreductase n=1 Tax=unclassified Pseudomonas TaxID=196821 RepID=UPI002448C4C8|nr:MULTISPECIES: nitronate monooxygenase [unclassified Pseudomonas]MDG9925913.1 nitronate monooxygenase [Pseudomonas sp. GD04045]MDH0034817.1 nitronate monooxygenase [Pseudomonas sp. GD04019]